ncbi:MAG TPA: energy-dependent translational throttle protein EttA [Planctomycetota bacterium]|nr:energy-dependent translational throttle protein EttA [Planctomycetota bacterium]
MAPQYIFTMEDLHKFHDKKEVLKGIWLSFFPGAKIGVLGNNGAGKSTLLRIMAGVDKDFEGTARPYAKATIGFVPQEPQLDNTKNVIGNLEEAVAPTKKLLKRYDEINEKLATELSEDEMTATLEELTKVQEQIDACDGFNLDRRLEIAMDALRLPPPDAEVTKLSGGEKRRVALCKTLMQAPDLLLLDEPTNHLDAESVAWLERHLKEYKGAVIAVTHDRYFLDNVAGWILELDRGKGIPWQGNYSSWLEQKQKRLEVEEKQEKSRQKTLERELEWVRMSPKARTAKSKARLSAYEQLAAQQVEVREESFEMRLPPAPHLGDKVVIAKDLSKGFGDRLLMENVNFSLPPGGIVGIIGPNGAGKTTLFKMIIGSEKPDAGSIVVGDTVVLSYVDQNRDTLDPEKTVYEEISGGNDDIYYGKQRLSARGYAARFNFKGADQQKKVGVLSGGERNRVQLAKLLKRGGNVLLLDEPTNDLDVDTLRALEEALENFAGCAVIISHDRWFLDRVATHILAFEGDSKVRWFEGNFQAYEEKRREELGHEADQPHRIKYRKLQH